MQPIYSPIVFIVSVPECIALFIDCFTGGAPSQYITRSTKSRTHASTHQHTRPRARICFSATYPPSDLTGGHGASRGVGRALRFSRREADPRVVSVD